MLEILTRAGYLQVQGDCLTTTPAVEQNEGLERDRREQTERLLNAHPFMRAFDRLLEACLDGCADVMRAARHPSQVLFPGGSKTLVEDTYKTDVYAAYANEIVREVVCRYIEHRSDRPLRMVEVGAGTGATTEVVLRAIAGSASPVRYVYTDVSKSFVQQGAAAFGGRYGFVEFKPLDLEQDPDAQGFERHGADVVIGTNVFHATRDIRHSLRAAKRLLKTGGLLILNETTRLSDFGTMTFGLTSGWWSYQDAEYRIPSSPLLSVAGWRQVLALCGYREVRVFGRPGVADAELDRAVIVAESDGWVESAVVQPCLAIAPPKRVLDAAPRGEESAVSDAAIEARALEFVRGVFADVLRMPAADLSANANFERYGVDSLMVMELTDALKRHIQGIESTLLFEHTSIAALAGYFARAHGGAIASMLAPKAGVGGSAEPLVAVPECEPAGAVAGRPTTPDTGIAVIGMSGRFSRFGNRGRLLGKPE